ncbi:uncharacterized protein LOC117144788 [Drosophila mauritiana]|uniref:Uncharacterized protein LOC117144788 n=1 Tax=Drosophila mauritiana TaxID=7226 RepID=A0A6P8KB55_DROMA|nr:uncharacterized protein LOC117144788 [Drosophila mauritiana]
MHSFLIAAVAFLSYTCGAPADSGALTLNESNPEDSDESVETSPPIDWSSGYWITTTPLPPIVNLPDADKAALCQFLGSFEAFRMQHFAVIWAANMEFLSNAEKHFAKELQEEMDKLRNSPADRKYMKMDPTQANAIVRNATAYKEFVKDNVVKENTLKMMNKIFEGLQAIHKEIMVGLSKAKNSISKETAESEKKFFESFENWKEPNNDDILDLLNDQERKLKHRYQCSKSLILRKLF